MYVVAYQKIPGYANQLAKDMMSSSFITTEILMTSTFSRLPQPKKSAKGAPWFER